MLEYAMALHIADMALHLQIWPCIRRYDPPFADMLARIQNFTCQISSASVPGGFDWIMLAYAIADMALHMQIWPCTCRYGLAFADMALHIADMALRMQIWPCIRRYGPAFADMALYFVSRLCFC